MSIEKATLNGAGRKRLAPILGAMLITLVPAAPALAGICGGPQVAVNERLAALCARTAQEQVEAVILSEPVVAQAIVPVLAETPVVEAVAAPAAPVVAAVPVKQDATEQAQVRPVPRPENLQPAIKLASVPPFASDPEWTSGVYR